MVNDDNFDEAVLQSKKLSIVMLWQPACGFCKVMLYALATVARAMPGANFVVMSGPDNPKTRDRFAIDAFPTLLAFRNGECIDRKTGTASIGAVTAWVKERMM